jgi:UDP-2,3-diacylglucosamine pyrophosphatase LpxH
VRTLIVSDLHLGNRLDHDVLTRPAAIARLRAAVAGVDRFVLLGDTLELMHGRPEFSMRRAEPVLRRIAAALDPEAQVVLVPGNHDFPLVRRWVRADPSRLEVDTVVPPDASQRLARVVDWLGGRGRVTVRYPGVWLTPEVYAIHGHYIDHHLMPHSAFGISRGAVGGLPDGRALPAAYESRRQGHDDRDARTRLGDRVAAGHIWVLGSIRRRLLGPRLAPVTSALLDRQMRGATIPAVAHVVSRLGVEAKWVIYGHVHRAGPLVADDLEQWSPGPAVLNTGSWLFEPVLVGRAEPPHGYWPGGAVLLEQDGLPQAIGLLDDLNAHDLG